MAGKRVFVYENREFPDPDPGKTIEEVKRIFADFFPELVNAEHTEVKRGEDTVVEFIKRVGTKGSSYAAVA